MAMSPTWALFGMPPSAMHSTFLLLCQCCSGTVVLQGNDKEREIFRSRLVHVTFRIGDGWATIGQEHAEAITRNDEDPQIDRTSDEGFAQMDEVDYQKVAPCRELNLDAHTDARAIHDATLDPIDISSLRLGPAASFEEARIEEFPHRGPAVCVTLFFHAQRETGDNCSYVIYEPLQAEPLNSLLCSVVWGLFGDDWHGRPA
jgi:hypothetical protein